jgi:hypothetical protein
MEHLFDVYSKTDRPKMQHEPMNPPSIDPTKSRPFGINETSVLLIGSSLLEHLRQGAPHIDLDTPAGHTKIIGLAVNFLIFCVIVFFYRRGFNWARWAVFVICALSLLEVTTLNRPISMLSHALTLLDMAMAIFLFWYLNASPIRRWFRLRREAKFASYRNLPKAAPPHAPDTGSPPPPPAVPPTHHHTEQ